MSLNPRKEDDRSDGEDREDPQVPEGVLRGIDDVEEERTASKEDIEAVLKF
jgi:hypothetical protein